VLRRGCWCRTDRPTRDASSGDCHQNTSSEACIATTDGPITDIRIGIDQVHRESIARKTGSPLVNFGQGHLEDVLEEPVHAGEQV
jgi:hypothetical protein